MEKEDEKRIIFLDHANIWKNLKKFRGRIDYVKLKAKLSQESYLVGALIYMGLPHKVSVEQKKFITYIKNSGYVPYFKRVLETRSKKTIKH